MTVAELHYLIREDAIVRLIIGILFLTVAGCTDKQSSEDPKLPVCANAAHHSYSEHISERQPDALTGSEFMELTRDMTYGERQQAATHELLAGNVPDRLREPAILSFFSNEGDTLYLLVTHDYISIGSDDDFVRMPLSLPSARAVARHFNMYLPTTALVDAIYEQAGLKIAPEPMEPGPEMRSNDYYLRHHSRIEEQIDSMIAGQVINGMLIAGHKKDVVITSRMTDQPDRVPIYGWHRSAGDPIQPLSLIHGADYEDYSHGLRLVGTVACLNGEPVFVFDLFNDPVWASVLSNEPGIDPEIVFRLR